MKQFFAMNLLQDFILSLRELYALEGFITSLLGKDVVKDVIKDVVKDVNVNLSAWFGSFSPIQISFSPI